MNRNRGTYEGDAHEIELVKDFNKNKNNYKFKNYLSSLKISNVETIYMVRVTTKQLSLLSNQKVLTRSDAYLITSFDQNIKQILLDNDYYLSEDLLKINKVEYSPISMTGLSIKMPDSKNYQILKLTPLSFKKLFNLSELGAGASLYCKKESELIKNKELISGWLSSINSMKNYFSNIINDTKDFYLDINICKKIKEQSIKEITELIESNEILKKKIFNGKYLYEEPYVAHYISHISDVKTLNYIPYSITTGSGRSKENYTLVLKPR